MPDQPPQSAETTTENSTAGRYDVVIAGGGVIGSACAYFLAENPDFEGSVAVIEPDPSYQYSASALSASSIRQQFSSPVNIAISQFGMAFLKSADQHLALDGVTPDLGLVESTYLYLATQAGNAGLCDNTSIQKQCGVACHQLLPDALSTRFPWMNFEDIALGAVTDHGEGWFDAYQLLMGFRARARAGGVDYFRARVEQVVCSSAGVSGVKLGNGETITCGNFVNATGCHAREIAQQAGIELPVFPRKRCVFVFECAHPVEGCPLVVDPSGLWFRPEGHQFICGIPPNPDVNVAPDDFMVDHDLFEEQIWPLLAERVPAFAEIRVTNYWAGHYDYNVFDQNAIVGAHPTVKNFYLANGFSGHGLQQAPAVGRGLSEQITYGEYRSLDLSPLGYQRILDNAPLVERNCI